jgi:GNAT superfamily N-acetyltransferase
VTTPGQIQYRRATEADLPACEVTWRDSLNDYLVPLGQYEVPPDNPSLRLLLSHTRATDPDRFWVATRPGPDDAPAAPDPSRPDTGPEHVVAFASGVRRGRLRFLSMLFVRPFEQGTGIGRSLLARVMPSDGDGAVLATVADAAQPISNGLYASFGMVPRLPMFNLVGRPSRPEVLAELPTGVHAVRFDATAPAERDRLLDAELRRLDAETLGAAHQDDHDFFRRQGRIGFAYRDVQGDLLGYGYTSEVGRIGPVATRDPALQAPIVAHLLGVIVPRGASAIWVPGAAGPTTEMLVRAGLRIEGFPVLVCWSRPFADFSRYLPFAPGLL